MKLYCPRCHAENDSETAQAGAVRCVSCEKWFSEKEFTPWSPAQNSSVRSGSPVNAGLILWPAVLLVVLLAGLLGFIPLFWTALLALFAILGSIITFLAQKK